MIYLLLIKMEPRNSFANLILKSYNEVLLNKHSLLYSSLQTEFIISENVEFTVELRLEIYFLQLMVSH